MVKTLTGAKADNPSPKYPKTKARLYRCLNSSTTQQFFLKGCFMEEVQGAWPFLLESRLISWGRLVLDMLLAAGRTRRRLQEGERDDSAGGGGGVGC